MRCGNVLGTLALGLALLTVEVRPAAACSKRHQTLFELFDEAATVAVARVTAAPGRRGAGRVTLAVSTSLKGRKGTVMARETNTSCHVGFRRGRTALVFVRADGWPAGHYEGYVEKPPAAMVATMQAWSRAVTAAERTAVLVAAITGTDPVVAYDAAMYLADEPVLLAALDATTKAALATATVRGDVLDRVQRRLDGGPYEKITSAAALADLIDQTRGEKSQERIDALERCERVHGLRLERYAFYRNGVAAHYWTKLAAACRTGTPVR